MGEVIRLNKLNEDFNTEVNNLTNLCKQDLQSTNRLIIEKLDSNVPLIKEIASYLILSGGKRLRPLLTACSFHLINNNNNSNKNYIGLAAAVEFIHAATLLHDDVIDESKIRRGAATANDIFGNKTSVLVGDFLFSRAFELMVQYGSKQILEVLSKASSTIAQGEVLQLTTINDSSTNQELYMKIIENKTASLFSAASEISAILSEEKDIIQKSLKTYGQKLGIAFQLIDDALDYAGTSALDKSIGDDFREGKMTLPVIISLEKSNPEEKTFWKKTIEDLEQSSGDLNKAIELINKYHGISSTLTLAKTYSEEAIKSLEIFPQSEAKLALESLASIAVNRKK